MRSDYDKTSQPSEVFNCIAANYLKVFGDDESSSDGWGKGSDDNEAILSDQGALTLPADLNLKFRDEYECYPNDESFEHLSRLNQEIIDLQRNKLSFIKSIDAISDFQLILITFDFSNSSANKNFAKLLGLDLDQTIQLEIMLKKS